MKHWNRNGSNGDDQQQQRSRVHNWRWSSGSARLSHEIWCVCGARAHWQIQVRTYWVRALDPRTFNFFRRCSFEFNIFVVFLPHFSAETRTFVIFDAVLCAVWAVCSRSACIIDKQIISARLLIHMEASREEKNTLCFVAWPANVWFQLQNATKNAIRSSTCGRAVISKRR